MRASGRDTGRDWAAFAVILTGIRSSVSVGKLKVKAIFLRILTDVLADVFAGLFADVVEW